MTVLATLLERGFVQQCSNEKAVDNLLGGQRVTYYAGFDPTADSLHVGSLVPIMAMAHLQQAGHIPIAIIGGGTTLIGDPSGKTEMRRLMSHEEIERNGVAILAQLQRYLRFGEDIGIFINNAEWLVPLNHIEFLRDIGRYFKVNEMIKLEGYKQRLDREEGLPFIEFSYQLLQAYDFLVLFDRHRCLLQVGGNDQWSNILAGMNLVRTMRRDVAYGLTFPLITTATGQKMGKTEAGTIWLDAQRTSPYDFYQYWINTHDDDVARFLPIFTFLPMAEINKLTACRGAELRPAKEALAYEATKLAHGELVAQEARVAAQAAFGGGTDLSSLPTTPLSRAELTAGISVLDLFSRVGLTSSKGEARRLIDQKGLTINDEVVELSTLVVDAGLLRDERFILRRGKKQVHVITICDP